MKGDEKSEKKENISRHSFWKDKWIYRYKKRKKTEKIEKGKRKGKNNVKLEFNFWSRYFLSSVSLFYSLFASL